MEKMSATLNVKSAAHLAEILRSSRIVVADFYAEWCGPCKQIAPVYEQLSKAHSQPHKVTFVKINTETQLELAQTYGVTSLPTFILFSNGKVVDRAEGASAASLQKFVQKIQKTIESAKNGGPSGGDNSDAGFWRGAALPRGYTDITSQIELRRCELLNIDSDIGSVRVLFDSGKPSALSGGDGTAKDWVESDTDQQLMLFMLFQSMIKLHTLQITSLPPTDDDDDEVPTRPRTIKLFSNKPHNLGFDEAEDMAATQIIELGEKDWNEDGTANIPLRYVKFQNINSLVVFVVDGEGDSEKVRLDRLRLIGEAGEKREMGKLEKIGHEPGE